MFGQLLATLLGALLAASFGIFSHIYLESRRLRMDQKQSARIITNELESIRECAVKFRRLVDGTENPHLSPVEIFSSVIQGAGFIQNNNWRHYLFMLTGALSDEDEKIIRAFYGHFSHLDATMAQAIAFKSSGNDLGANSTTGLFWVQMREVTGKHLEEIVPIIEKLRKLGR